MLGYLLCSRATMGVKLIEQVSKLIFFCLIITICNGSTDPNDLQVLNDFRKGLENPELLKWPKEGDDDPCGPPLWPYVFCSEGRVTQIQAKNLGLRGILPQNFNQLTELNNLGLQRNNLSGMLPSFSGLSKLEFAFLDYNSFDAIPFDFFNGLTSLRVLSLEENPLNVSTNGWSFPLDLEKSTQLTNLSFVDCNLVGTLPDFLGTLPSLTSLRLSGNKLSGSVPSTFAQSSIQVLWLNNQEQGGFTGNKPCTSSTGPWFGLNCNSNSEVTIINLPKHKLNGTLSPSLAKLDSLHEIRLAENNITGIVPDDYTKLKSLRLLDLSDNNLESPLPNFHGVKVITVGNLFLSNQTGESASPISSPNSTYNPSNAPTSPKQIVSSSNHKRLDTVAGVSVSAVVAFLVVYLFLCFFKNKKTSLDASSSIVVHPRDPSDRDNVVKIAVSSNNIGSLSGKTGTSFFSNISGETQNSYLIEAGNHVISVQVLRKVTDNFASENELGRGGFGTVYKGELEDGTKIAVKRMEHGAIGNKAVEEFQSEIAVLSKVRHRHLVSLLGYSIEGNERLLVYEFMPLGALSQHLFHWKKLELKPLSWSQRLSIALDVARGMEYLHGLARETFIHRDLKSSNILLGDDFRAKVSDFGLVKLAPDGEKSVATKLAGTFGYLAPEYAVMGKITTKVDVFSYGVVLIELLTGLTALDESRSEEIRYLAEWFWRVKSNKEKLMAAIDPAFEQSEETYESITIVSELAGHCTAREAYHRPDMSHAVNVLSALVEKWRPVDDELDQYSVIDYNRPLPQMLKIWKDAESNESSYSNAASLEDSKGSIPVRPTGFADSFTSADAR
ncbi:receptor protein kinase TMK1-like isoform X2 [Cicer arietinum]|uniref:Receptor protein kinase TMK1-like isoform X2 n=1 Tax=Cicer arietinum TaxID=3827 RepID=A0A1S2XFE3_CICAR|nr:receptor protein kinase TMK1-like isoform X2 [Cicer arietinum]